MTNVRTFFSGRGGGSLRFVCFVSCFLFQHFQNVLCEAMAHMGDEGNYVVWRTWGYNSFTYVQNFMGKFPFLYRNSGICRWEPMYMWSKNLSGIGWIQYRLMKICGSKSSMGLTWTSFGVNPIALSNSRRGFVFISVLQSSVSEGHVYWEREDPSWKQDSIILGHCRNNLSLCLISNESLAQPEPCLWWMSLTLLQISSKQHIKTFMYKHGPVPIVLPGPKQRRFVVSHFCNFGNYFLI